MNLHIFFADNLLSSTQVTVLNVPESSIFEVVQTVQQDQTVNDVNVDDIHLNVCADNNSHQDELHQEQHQETKVAFLSSINYTCSI